MCQCLLDKSIVAKVFTLNLHVMGMLTAIGAKRENDRNGRKTKMSIIQLEADRYLYHLRFEISHIYYFYEEFFF